MKKPKSAGTAKSQAPDLRAELANLHDCFLNANLLLRLMLATPLDAPDRPSREGAALEAWARANPEVVTMSDRLRLERLWWDKLFVLIDSWRKASKQAKALFLSLPSNAALSAMLRALAKAGLEVQLRETRHYMSHRGDRAYWDQGRDGPMGNLRQLLELQTAFGAVFLEAIAALPPRPRQ